jgi:hypothetical protein
MENQRTINRYVVAEHPLKDVVLLGFAKDNDIMELGFSLSPQDAVDIGKELVSVGQRILDRQGAPVESGDGN